MKPPTHTSAAWKRPARRAERVEATQREGRSTHMPTIGIPRRPDKRANRARVGRFVSSILVVAVLAGSFSTRPAAAVDRLDGTTPRRLGVPLKALPDVGMKAGALVTEDGRVLWSRHARDRRAIASITKIMTAVVALENGDIKERVAVPASARQVGESTSFLRVGERLPMGDLLEALLVKSGNDAAITIAEHVSGGEDEFVELMNAKAETLGLSRTHFTNSHGLDESGHYSCATDLAVLARYAMRKPFFRKIVAEKYADIGSGKRKERVENTNLLVGNYDGANGIKTGWTTDAGYSVIVSARRGGVELYAVVLGTPGELARFRDARELLDWGFAHYREQELASAGTVVAKAVVVDYLDITVPAAVSRDSTAAVFDLAGSIERSVKVAEVRAPIEVGDRIGVATFTQAGRIIETIPLVAAAEVAAPNAFQRVGIALVRGWRRVFGGPMTATATPREGE